MSKGGSGVLHKLGELSKLSELKLEVRQLEGVKSCAQITRIGEITTEIVQTEAIIEGLDSEATV